MINSLKSHLFQHFSVHDLYLILRNSGWLIFEKVGRLTLNFAANILIVRYLGPQDFGEIAYALSCLAILQSIASLGFEGIAIREISRDPDRAKIILGTATTLRLIVALTLFFTAACVNYLSTNTFDENQWIYLVISFQLIFQVSDCIDYWFQSNSESGRSVLVKLVASIVFLIVKIYFIYVKADVIYFAYAITFESALTCLGLLASYLKFPCHGRWIFKKNEAKFLFGQSWPFMFAAIINIIQARVEFLIIKIYLGNGFVGQYAVALSLIEIFDVLGVIITNSIFPRIARNNLIKINSMMRLLYLFTFFMYALIFPVLIIFFIFFLSIYGVNFTQAKYIYILLMLRPILAYIGLARGIYLRLRNRNRYALSSAVTGMVIAIFASILLIPVFGVYGAALSAILSYVVSNFLLDFFFCKRNFYNIIHCYRLRV